MEEINVFIDGDRTAFVGILQRCNHIDGQAIIKLDIRTRQRLASVHRYRRRRACIKRAYSSIDLRQFFFADSAFRRIDKIYRQEIALR